jgi:DNA-binding transcriptional regulator PaaX
MKLGVMEIKTLYRATKVGWYEDWCPATCKRMKAKGLIVIGTGGKIKLTDQGRLALSNSQEVLAQWGWT